MFFKLERIKATVCSAADRELPDSELIILIFFFNAYLTSIWSVPLEQVAIILNFVLSINSLSIFLVLLIIRISKSE